MTTQESNSLTYLRVFAMFSIVVCHLSQAYYNQYRLIWGDVFNMGVQVFLVMSGFLYGNKTVTNWKEWAYKRIKKIYIPYLVFLVVVIPLYLIFHIEAVKWKALPFYYVNLQGFRLLVGGGFGRIEGLRHVWFVTAIMCAYLTTPLLQRLRKHANWVLPCLLALILICYVGAPSLKYVFVLSWFYLYAIGYLFVNLSANWKKFYLALFTVGLIVILSKIDVRSFSNSYSTIYRAIHDIVGVFVVVVGVWCLSKIKNIKVPGAITMFDKYSYYIFLVHFTIMHGPFSMAYITPYIGLNILIMLLSTTVATFLFVKILNFVESIIGKTEEKYINSKQR